ncbi:endo-1,4-beta-xylanase [Actinopolymorpha singaporensis]
MGTSTSLHRRAFLLGAGAAATAGVVGLGTAETAHAAEVAGTRVAPLWRAAARKGLLFGSSAATWQLEDADYADLHARHAALLLTEDDLLWWRLRPTPDSGLDFTYADRIVEFAERNRQLVLGAHLVWDQGFGDGWGEDDLWNIPEDRARELLYGTMRAVMRRYRHRVPIWSVVNEAIVNGTDTGHGGLREDVPWFQTIGPDYVAHAFRVAHDTDSHACLMMNDFGYETVNQWGDEPADKQRNTLRVLDDLLGAGVPVHAFGIQGHLLADRFHERFHARQYLRFLSELADRGLRILITELDVLDDGLPTATGPRDRMVADVYRRYLDVTLECADVVAVVDFGLSDRYTWLDEDYPREDGTHRRPLPFDADLRPVRAYHAERRSLGSAPRRRPAWKSPRTCTHR